MDNPWIILNYSHFRLEMEQPLDPRSLVVDPNHLGIWLSQHCLQLQVSELWARVGNVTCNLKIIRV